MRAVFFLLLLTNIIFLLVQWLYPYNPALPKPRAHVAAKTLHLLNESETSFAKALNKPEDSQQTSDATAAQLPTRLCYTLGPFKKQQDAQEVALKFKQNKIDINLRSSLEKEYMGMMVYIDEHESREAAVKTAENLAAEGVHDYIIVNEPDKANILSLGVFGLKKNALRRQKNIARLGYDVKTEARYRNRTIYWLDYSESENESLTRFIDRLKQEKGISRISRQCDA
jgi:hypothetical protein